MNGLLKKLFIILGIAAVIGVGWGVDSIIVKSYSIDVKSVEQITEEDILDVNGNVIPRDCGVTDGQTKVHFEVLLSKNSSPVVGHTLYVKTNRNVLGRYVTDEKGLIHVDYRCYKATNPDKVKDITLTFKDENNSLFVAVPATSNYVLKMYQPKASGSGMTTNDVFFEI